MARNSDETGLRRDVVATDSVRVSDAVEKGKKKAFRQTEERKKRSQGNGKVDAQRLAIRKDLLEPRRSDPFGYERVIGDSDLLSINFLERGRRAAAAVCRIKVPSPAGPWYGTGFLVGPRLLLTNHHVLGSQEDASQANIEFEYEHDLDGALKAPVAFNLNPSDVFYTDSTLDMTFVGVVPYSTNNVPVSRYGRLPLLPLSGKGIDGEWVTIIQHPGGDPKQIAIRASQILEIDAKQNTKIDLDSFIYYSTDTEPGSSGSPVLNDQWQVLALHHKAVPSPDTVEKPEEEKIWIANEGVRISAIFRHLETYRFSRPQAGAVLARLERSLGFAPLVQTSAEDDLLFEKDRAALPMTRWKDVQGYDPNFLSEPIDLASIYAPALAKDRVAPLLDGSGHELPYRHFSCVVEKQRKFPLLTAVNINGKSLAPPGDRAGWRRDKRIADEYQPDGDFYEKAKGKDAVTFDRGHQVRYLDPCWGDDNLAALAGEDTLHYTNAAPQVHHYNDIEWGNLEDYILDKAQTTEKKLTVFTGPVYRDDDPIYGRDRPGGPWRIPLSFWKIAVLQKFDDQIVAAAFVIGQTQYVQALYEAKVFTGLNPYSVDELRQNAFRPPLRRSKQSPDSISGQSELLMRRDRWKLLSGRGGLRK